jgi:hypothetical protein
MSDGRSSRPWWTARELSAYDRMQASNNVSLDNMMHAFEEGIAREGELHAALSFGAILVSEGWSLHSAGLFVMALRRLIAFNHE